MIRPTLPLALVGVLLAAAPAAAADLGAPFTTLEGTCGPTDSKTLVVAQAPVERALVRASVVGGPVRASDVDVAADEVVWFGTQRSFGDAMSVPLDCSRAADDTTYRLELHPMPDLPTTIRGRGGRQSLLGYTLTQRAAVGADLEVAGGRVVLGGGDIPPFGSGAGSTTLGTMEPGTGGLAVTADPGTDWTVRLRALPATLSDLRLGGAIPAGTAGVTGQFTLDRPSRVQVTVHDQRGAGIDWPLTPRDIDAGTFSVGWDGRTVQGELVPDGRYELRVRSTDAAGTTSSLAGPVLVDRSAPRVAIRRAVGPRGTATVTASDEPAGIASLTATTTSPSRTFVAVPGERTVDVPPPAGGWGLGATPIRVVATDHAGNRTVKTLTLLPRENDGLPCGRDAAIDRVLNTAKVARALARTRAARGTTVARAYRLARVLCSDLDGDGVREMAVLLRARRDARAATPLVVFRVGASRMHVPRVISTRYVVRGLVVRGRRFEGRVTGGRRLTVRDAGGTLVLRVR